jgi:imidazolonepropionase-like amidohydrolase
MSSAQDIELRAFVGATVLNGTGAAPIPDGVLVVRSGRIEAIGPRGSVAIPIGAEVVDLAGKWLLPGLINSHGHLSGSRDAVLEQLATYAHYGVTTVISIGGDETSAIALRNEQEVPLLTRTRVFASGPVINPNTPESARSEVARVDSLGANWVKIRVDGGATAGGNKMSPEVYSAVIDEARIRGLPVAIHIWELEDAKGVVAAGGTMVAHSVRDSPVDAELLEMMRERDVCLVPTLTRELSTFVYAERPAFFDDPFFLEKSAPSDLAGFLTPQRQNQARTGGADWRERLPTAQENLRRTLDAGVRVAMGTDTGASLPGRFLGYFEHLEMEMMVQSGLSPAEVIVSATGVAASCVGLEDEVGTLRPGRWADLLVVGADPTVDILNARKIESVWIAGNQVR